MTHKQTQKVTVHIPIKLLEKALATTGKNITETIIIALKQLAHANAYNELRKMRGKIKFSIDLKELRQDK